ncbi:ATP-binding protein [Rhodophyticola sp. CCM32]|uniref:ATP-binding protein n=1 Tax=Rhodophyticola sp. CCM32 TaxID=2916397 RepID=UPI001AEF8056|nr:ATP-binding protein [Rhodophyticola sp. CCM32]
MEETSNNSAPVGASMQSDLISETLRLFNHDIRAAMSDVIGGLRLVDMDHLDAETRAQLERVCAAGETLAELVDAALMAAAGETLIRLDDSGVDLRGYLTGVNMRWAGRAVEAGCCFVLERDPDLPDRIGVPRMALDRILSNLIGNALKHGGKGRVTLCVSMAADDTLKFSITDQGPGFSAAAMARLFTARGRPEMDTRPGSGLGLHIAKDLADGLGGDLEVSDTDGQGAAVTLSLSRMVWQAGPATGEGPGDPPDLSDLRILVAEDNETNQVIVRQLLGNMGAAPVIVNDGIEALDVLGRESFDIALVDIEMPRMSGIELMAAIRGLSDARAQMPLVALTAYVLRDNREAIYAAGADGIIGKPIRSGEAFGRSILRHAGRDLPISDAGAVLATLEAEDEMSARIDMARFEALLVAAGPDGSRELLARLHDDLHNVSSALDTAVETGALRAIRGQTHILLSLAGAAGADRLRHLAEALNLAAQRGRISDLPGLAVACRADLTDLIALIETRRATISG